MSHFSVTLSHIPASAPYPNKALVSFSSHGATIHLQPEELAKNWLRPLQKAARKIANVGVSKVEFIGNWTTLQQQVFVQSFCASDFDGEFKWIQNASDSKDETNLSLDNYLDALLFTKGLIDQTPEKMSPEQLANQIEDWLLSLAPNSTRSQRWTGTELKDAGWMGIYEVGRGSDRPPVLLEVDFNPSGNEEAEVVTALVGKGITFDSGGYSIKSSEGMLDMKCDMGGAATLSGALGFAIMQGLKKRVKFYVCCAENLISGHAYKLGDIITYKNGTSVEIVNTDAEGRLVLADGLMAACETNAKYIIDAATLTGAAVMAVGREYNAVFSLSESASKEFIEISKSESEWHWPLPLEPWHQEQCPSPFADTANSRPQKGGGGGGASNAAGFLSRFVDWQSAEWLHIDLAAAYSRNATDLMPAGGTGLGVRSIAKAILQR